MEEVKQDPTYYHFGKGETTGKIEVKNSYKLQLTSLLLFASTIGYVYNPLAETDGDNFIYIGDYKIERSIVKFNTMRDWYNYSFMSKRACHGLDIELPIRAKELQLPLESMRIAVGGKLTTQVYLQSNKKKELTVQRHVVKFAE